MKKIIKFILIGLFFPFFVQAQPKHEIRAVWLTTLYSLDWPTSKATSSQGIQRQKKELCDILDKLERANFNTILFQTRLRGDVIYPSQIEAFDECLTGKAGGSPGYDPLQFAIEECHKRNMEIHAWVVALPLGNTRQNKELGRKAVTRKRPELCKLYQGHWYLDPGHPETKHYLSRIVMEIVDHYDIDGIHLDYIRYPEKAHKFPDYGTYKRYGKGKEMNEWRRNNVTAIVRYIYNNVKDKKPWVKVSSSPVGKYSSIQRYDSKGWNALNTVHQDAQLWMKEGINDILFPMMYFKDNNFFPFALDWNEHKNGRFIAPGLGIYFLDEKKDGWQLEDVMKQLLFIRKYQLDGAAFFRNRFVIENTKNILCETAGSFFSQPSFIPAMTWADSIAPSVPAVSPQKILDGDITLHWKPSTNNDNSDIKYRIYASNHYPVDINQVQNIICKGTKDTLFIVRSSNETSHRLYWAVTAVDRYGNESKGSAFNVPEITWNNIYHVSDINIKDGDTLIISTIAGKELMRISDHTQDNIRTLRKGFYRLSRLNTKGQQTTIGLLAL